MAETDRAIVVGINVYPDLGNLDGPENDAQEFYDWLVDRQGGNVPKERITLILSSAFQSANGAPPVPKPEAGDIERAFNGLLREALATGSKGLAKSLGRRLYVYVAGHGQGLSFRDDPELSDAALLTAEATNFIGTHVLARRYALYFLKTGIFDEIAVFMDCCKMDASFDPRLPNYSPNVSTLTGGINNHAAFFAYATGYLGKSREKLIKQKPRGIFTVALLKGLRFAADEDGNVTSSSLRAYLMNRMQELLTPEELASNEIPGEPYIPAPNQELIFCKTAPPAAWVRLSAPNQAQPVNVRILGSGFKPAGSGTIPPNGRFELSLPRDNYLVDLFPVGGQPIAPPGAPKTFSVVGDEEAPLDVVVG